MRELLRAALVAVDVEDEAEGSATGTGMMIARLIRIRWACGKVYTTGRGGMSLKEMGGGCTDVGHMWTRAAYVVAAAMVSAVNVLDGSVVV